MIPGLIAAAALVLQPAASGSSTAAPATPRAVVLAMFAAFNRHDSEAIARLYSLDAVLTSSEFCAPRGQRDVARTYRAMFAAMPDLRDQVETIVAEGEHVAVRFTANSAAARFSLPIQAMITVRGGRIVADHSVFDTGGRPCER